MQGLNFGDNSLVGNKCEITSDEQVVKVNRQINEKSTNIK